MKKLTIDELGEIKTIAYIPTIKEEYRKQCILIEFDDGSVIDYTFENWSEEKYKCIKDINYFDCYTKSKKLKKIIKKVYPNVKNVYIADL